MVQARVFLGMPCMDERPYAGAAQAFERTCTEQHLVHHRLESGSSLPQVFNKLWALALKNAAIGQITHFAMLHSDVVPLGFWLDILIGELERTGADLISAVIPIKNQEGLTSTAMGDPDDPWHYRRITMTEAMQLPETFGAEDVPFEIAGERGKTLLVNTGCWVCDLRRPWWNSVDALGRLNFYFVQWHRILVLPDGEPIPEFVPEDWLFSRMCAAHGVRVQATRKVRLLHLGGVAWPNDQAWGNHKTDCDGDAYFARVGKHPVAPGEHFDGAKLLD